MPRDYLKEAIKDARRYEEERKAERVNHKRDSLGGSREAAGGGAGSKRYRRYAISAIVVDSSGKEVVQGRNSYVKTHPLQARYADILGESDKQYMHAEIHAISRATKPYAIYIARVDSTGATKLAKPCRICEKAIKEAGIKEVHYTV